MLNQQYIFDRMLIEHQYDELFVTFSIISIVKPIRKLNIIGVRVFYLWLHPYFPR